MDSPEDNLAPSEFSGPVKAGSRFENTHWTTVVLAVRQEDTARVEAAMQKLCGIYWYPIYSFLRRDLNPHDAEDMAQGFFEYLLEYKTLQRADRDKGRFRTFLLHALKDFRINEWKAARAIKRGGGREIVSFDALLAEELYGREPANALTPEKLYERQCACALMERALGRLKEAFTDAGKSTLFPLLRACLKMQETPIKMRI